MDLCHVNPEFNLYDPEWPLRTHQLQAPPAKFVFADDGRRCGTGARFDDLRRLHHFGQPGVAAACCARTCGCTASARWIESILMPGVRVGRHARIRRAIIDRDVFIPRGAHIGYNEEEDRRRHTVSDNGIVVVTKDDKPFIGADRRRRAARRGGVRSTADRTVAARRPGIGDQAAGGRGR